MRENYNRGSSKEAHGLSVWVGWVEKRVKRIREGGRERKREKERVETEVESEREQLSSIVLVNGQRNTEIYRYN